MTTRELGFLCKRVKNLDSLYLEWDFYFTKWAETRSDNYRELADRARAAYERLVRNPNSSK